MADNGNGKFEARVGDKSLSLGGKDIVSVLLILVAGLGGYFVATQVTTNQQQGFLSLAGIVTTMNTNQATELDKLTRYQEMLVALVHTNRQQMEEQIRAQNVLLHQQTTALITKVDEQSTQLLAHFATLTRHLSVLNYNIHKDPSEQLPLDLPLPLVPVSCHFLLVA